MYKQYRITVIPVGYVAGRSSEPNEIDQVFTAKTAGDAKRLARAYLVDVFGWSPSDGRIKLQACEIDACPNFQPVQKGL